VNDLCSDIVCTVYGIRPIAERLEYNTENTERQGFLSSRPNWLPRPLTPQASVAPPLCFQRGGTHSLVGEGAGGANSDEGSATLVLGTCIVHIIPLPVVNIDISDTLASEGWQLKQCSVNNMKKLSHFGYK
jgi:hypothetical protein